MTLDTEQDEILANHRFNVAMVLLYDRKRAGKNGIPCELTHFFEHKCSGRIEMNEVLYPRKAFQSLPFEDQLKFYCVENCSLVCNVWHQRHGHSREFRELFLQHVIRIYGLEHMQTWNNNLPLKTSRIYISSNS